MSKLREKGITLIVLIVTVIILLILVGVTIGQITGNKGLFNRVRKTVSQYENTQEQEDAGMVELETMLAEERENIQELEEPTANPEDVLYGKSYYDKNKEAQEGTMEDIGKVTETINAGESYIIPAGYHNGQGTVAAKSLAEQTAGTAIEEHILSGDKAWVNGKELTGKMTNHGGNNIEVTEEDTTIPEGYYNGKGKIVAKNKPSIDHGGGPIVASILAYCASWSSSSKWLGLFYEDNLSWPDNCFYDLEYITLKNATSGGYFGYNSQPSTFSLTKSIKYTLLVSCAGVDSGQRDGNWGIGNIKITDGTTNYLNTNGGGIIHKIEIQGPVQNLHMEANNSTGGGAVYGNIIVMI